MSVDDALGRAEAAEHRRGGDEVGRRDDRRQQERRGPAHAVDERVRGDRDRADRQRDEHDRGHRDLARVAQQVPRRGLVARGVHERRDEDEEDDLGLELEHGSPGSAPSPSPPTTSTIGYGIDSCRATQTSRATATRSATKNSMSPTTREYSIGFRVPAVTASAAPHRAAPRDDPRPPGRGGHRAGRRRAGSSTPTTRRRGCSASRARDALADGADPRRSSAATRCSTSTARRSTSTGCRAAACSPARSPEPLLVQYVVTRDRRAPLHDDEGLADRTTTRAASSSR